MHQIKNEKTARHLRAVRVFLPLHRQQLLRAMAGGLALCAALAVCTAYRRCNDIRQSVVRLHILANSDTEADQALKLTVRDAVTSAAAGWLDGAADADEALQLAENALPQLQAAAEAALRAADSTQSVHAEVCRMYFPTREYAAENGTVTLPAGMYDAVRLTLGEGKGHNWWCVVFPPMCLGAAADEKQLGDVLSPDEERFVTGGSRYTVRFWLIEQIEALLRRFRK